MSLEHSQEIRHAPPRSVKMALRSNVVSNLGARQVRERSDGHSRQAHVDRDVSAQVRYLRSGEEAVQFGDDAQEQQGQHRQDSEPREQVVIGWCDLRRFPPGLFVPDNQQRQDGTRCWPIGRLWRGLCFKRVGGDEDAERGSVTLAFAAASGILPDSCYYSLNCMAIVRLGQTLGRSGRLALASTSYGCQSTSVDKRGFQ